MLGQAVCIAEELRIVQDRATQSTQQLYLLMRVKEGDQVRVRWESGGRTVEHVGFVRVLSDFTFFLELSTGALLFVGDLKYLEIMHADPEKSGKDVFGRSSWCVRAY